MSTLPQAHADYLENSLRYTCMSRIPHGVVVIVVPNRSLVFARLSVFAVALRDSKISKGGLSSKESRGGAGRVRLWCIILSWVLLELAALSGDLSSQHCSVTCAAQHNTHSLTQKSTRACMLSCKPGQMCSATA
jgi:hypothetical protein